LTQIFCVASLNYSSQEHLKLVEKRKRKKSSS
jgi:hypothetical protein